MVLVWVLWVLQLDELEHLYLVRKSSSEATLKNIDAAPADHFLICKDQKLCPGEAKGDRQAPILFYIPLEQKQPQHF